MVKFPESIKSIGIYNASHVTTELPAALLYALRITHGHPAYINIVNEINYESLEVLYIIICPAGFGSDAYVRKPKYYITYQLEPTIILERETYRDFLRGAIMNWDYSKANVDYCNNRPELNIAIGYLPIGYTPCISSANILYHSIFYNESEKDIDVLFLGWDAHKRRRQIREKLTETGLNVQFLINLDLAGMQAVIRRAKICLNLHALDNMINLETVRLNILLSNQACIVCEDLNDDTKLIYDKHMIIVNYDKIVSTCQELITQPELRKKIAMESFNWYSTERQWNKIAPFKLLLPTL